MKRKKENFQSIFDKIFAFISILFTLPIWVFVSIAIKFESKGSVFYKQKRVGRDKKEFNMFKFRTMYEDGELILKHYLEKNHKVRKEWEKYRKLRGYDPRVTRIGKFLRKYSIDELPQLLNIFKGEMSFIGPRPYLNEELPRFPEQGKIVFSVKPGLTGPWQVGGRNLIPFAKRVEMDIAYVQNRNIFKDLVYLLKGFFAIFKGQGF